MCTGSKVTYRIQIDHIQLPGFCMSRGNVPVNITVAPDIINQLGIGCHRLTIYASNTVTFSDVSAHLEVSLPGPQPSIFGPILILFSFTRPNFAPAVEIWCLYLIIFFFVFLQICVLEKISGLQASVLADKEANLNSESVAVGVSLEQGVPALLLFTLLQHNTISKSAEINTKKAIFHLGHHFNGRS